MESTQNNQDQSVGGQGPSVINNQSTPSDPLGQKTPQSDISTPQNNTLSGEPQSSTTSSPLNASPQVTVPSHPNTVSPAQQTQSAPPQPVAQNTATDVSVVSPVDQPSQVPSAQTSNIIQMDPNISNAQDPASPPQNPAINPQPEPTPVTSSKIVQPTQTGSASDDLLTDKTYPDDLDARWSAWKCLECGYVYEGVRPLYKCPRCQNEDPDKFD